MNILNCSRIGILPLLAVFAMFCRPVPGETNFSITPGTAFQVTFPSLESYQYQVDSSTNMTSWTPASTVQVATGTNLTMTFGMTNGRQAFYRVQQFPPNLSNRIVGLTNIYFDGATFLTTNNTGSISGFRAISRDYNLNDYITAQFQFDLVQQTLSLNDIQVSTNLGPIGNGQAPYFITNVTSPVVLTNGAMVLAADTLNTITNTGQVMSFNLQPGQLLYFRINGQLNYTNNLIVTGPGGVIFQTIVSPIASGVYDYWGQLIAPCFPGSYKLQLVPMGVASESITIEFHNNNGSSLVLLTNNMHLSTSVGPYFNDYTKFQANLNAGQTLTLGASPSSSYNISVFNVLGVLQDSNSGLPIVFTAPTTGTYYVIFNNRSLTATSYNTTVSISP